MWLNRVNKTDQQEAALPLQEIIKWYHTHRHSIYKQGKLGRTVTDTIGTAVSGFFAVLFIMYTIVNLIAWRFVSLLCTWMRGNERTRWACVRFLTVKALPNTCYNGGKWSLAYAKSWSSLYFKRLFSWVSYRPDLWVLCMYVWNTSIYLHVAALSILSSGGSDNLYHTSNV